MVRIFNICIDGDTVACDYDPEKSGKFGHVIIDIKSFEIINIDFSDYDYGKQMDVAQDRSKIEDLLKSNEPIPEEMYCVWF